jgi:hypothetical protein
VTKKQTVVSPRELLKLVTSQMAQPPVDEVGMDDAAAVRGDHELVSEEAMEEPARHAEAEVDDNDEEEEEEDDDDGDVSVCPIFTTSDGEEEEDCPRRNLDSVFASTPTLPKKRRLPLVVDGDSRDGPRQLPIARVGLGGATSDELSLERMQASGPPRSPFENKHPLEAEPANRGVSRVALTPSSPPPPITRRSCCASAPR